MPAELAKNISLVYSEIFGGFPLICVQLFIVLPLERKYSGLSCNKKYDIVRNLDAVLMLNFPHVFLLQPEVKLDVVAWRGNVPSLNLSVSTPTLTYSNTGTQLTSHTFPSSFIYSITGLGVLVFTSCKRLYTIRYRYQSNFTFGYRT